MRPGVWGTQAASRLASIRPPRGAGARWAALLLALALLGVACTGDGGGLGGLPDDGGSQSSPSAVVPASPEPEPSVEDGPGSSQAALEDLCTLPEPNVDDGSDVPAEGPTPDAIATVMNQLAEIRGFDFTQRVVAEPVTQQDIAEGYAEYLDAAFPEAFYERRSLAWQTIGVIPEGTSIREEMLEYGSTQVIGYYNTLTGELKFMGAEDPSPFERITLAHELTHAIDDQRFGLQQVDVLGAECRDEELQAALAVVEGNATLFMLRWAQTFLTAPEQVQVGLEAGAQEPPPSDVAPFIDEMQSWPYLGGLDFMMRLERDGGLDAVDGAFEGFPRSTEQIVHPERYPNDAPTPVDVPDIGPDLGRGWTDLDVEIVGEVWLDVALGLRLGEGEAATAAAGWDGGTSRAWSNGDEVAVVLSTVWDSEADAEEFAVSIGSWLEAGDGQDAAVLPVDGTSVRVLFGTSPEVLRSLEAAATAA